MRGIKIITILLSLWLLSCKVVRINRDYSTPTKAFQYPKFTLADSLRGTLNSYRSCYDVIHYDLYVKFYPEKKSIEGRVEILALSVDDFQTLQFDLYPNMKIDSIIWKNKPLSYRRQLTAVYVDLPSRIDRNQKFTITVYYRGTPQKAKRPPWEGGFVWKKDSQKNIWAGVACEVVGSSLWWPSKDHLSDEPDSVTLHYAVPAPLKCVANGILVDSVWENNYITYTWKVHNPINTYNVTFYFGNYNYFTLPYKSDSSEFEMSFYVLPNNLEKAKKHFGQVEDIIRFFENIYGSYPWPKDGYKLVESPYEGMEHQSAIAYGNKYRNHFHYNFDYIILHETAHEWWGNSVTANDYADIWLHEGFATYSEALYVEKKYGYEEYLKFLLVYALFIRNERPVVGPRDVNYWDYWDADVYMKGALILHTLRNIIQDDSLFMNILRSFYQHYRYRIVKTEDFISLVNQMTGKDFTIFFNQYLFNRSCPELQWEYFYDIYEGKAYLYFRFKKAIPNFSIPVRIKIQEKSYLIYPTTELQKVEIPPTNKLIINSNYSYIAIKRTNKFK